jgi:hypothetical protein
VFFPETELDVCVDLGIWHLSTDNSICLGKEDEEHHGYWDTGVLDMLVRVPAGIAVHDHLPRGLRFWFPGSSGKEGIGEMVMRDIWAFALRDCHPVRPSRIHHPA